MANTIMGTTNAALSAKILSQYDKILLFRATDPEMLGKFGQTRSIKARSNTKKAFAYRYLVAA